MSSAVVRAVVRALGPSRSGSSLPRLEAAEAEWLQDPQAAVDVAGQDQVAVTVGIDAPHDRDGREDALRVRLERLLGVEKVDRKRGWARSWLS
jgi:hypothetical protein